MSGIKEKLEAMQPLSISHIDGVKLDFEDGWLLVRASGTEPRLRVTAEARTAARMQQLYDDCIRIIRDFTHDKGEID